MKNVLNKNAQGVKARSEYLWLHVPLRSSARTMVFLTTTLVAVPVKLGMVNNAKRYSEIIMVW